MTFNPYIKEKIFAKTKLPHGSAKKIIDFSPVKYKRIAITVDFSDLDVKTIQNAMSQGGNDCEYMLIHIVETAGARLLGQDILDYETTQDANYLQSYAEDMMNKGYTAYYHLGFGEPSKTIPNIIKEFDADLLVMGAHGHKWMKDLLLGQTVNSVRHKVNIPVLVVS